LGLDGPILVEPEPHEDERGFFARSYSAAEFETAGLDPAVAECSISFNRLKATLRGLHLQKAPFGQAKLVRCTRGRIWDVAVDVRPGSHGFGSWVATELDEVRGWALYIPGGFAHGFITLEDACEVFYQCSQPHQQEADVGIRWDDPDIGVAWPLRPTTMSERDRHLPSLANFKRVLSEHSPSPVR
jgi:dTDP-4-dehydrorhamnose 3,5-epimerase